MAPMDPPDLRYRRSRIACAFAVWVGLQLLTHTSLGLLPPENAFFPVPALVVGALVLSRPKARTPVFIAFFALALLIAQVSTSQRELASIIILTTIPEVLTLYFLITRWSGPDLLNGKENGLPRFLAICASIPAIAYPSHYILLRSLNLEDPAGGATAFAIAHLAAGMHTLPLFLPLIQGRRSKGWELFLQCLLAVAIAASLLIPTSLPAQTVALFPLSIWLALRSSLIQLLSFGAIYASAVTVVSIFGLGYAKVLISYPGVGKGDVLALTQSYLVACMVATLPLSIAVANLVKRTREANDERKRIQRIVDSATGVLLLTMDRNGTITRFSPGGERILGYSAEEIIRTQPELVAPDEIKALMRNPDSVGDDYIARALGMVLRGGDVPVVIELPFRHKDTSIRTLSTTTTTVRDSEGEVTEFLVTGDDVTERVEGERALREALASEMAASERLSHIDTLKTELVSTVSHELRTPIASIIGYTELMQDHTAGKLNSGQEKMMDSIERGSRRLMRLVDNLLTVSRIEDTSIALNLEEFSVNSLIDSCVDGLGEAFRQAEVSLNVSSPPGDFAMVGDQHYLDRALANLLSNAAKFTPAQGAARLEVSYNPEGLGEVVIAISDTGIGIPPDARDQLFRRFFRAHNAYEQQVQGTGLGLYIADTVVRQHGGRIEVQSPAAAGTTFTVRLPRYPYEPLSRPMNEPAQSPVNGRANDLKTGSMNSPVIDLTTDPVTGPAPRQ